MQRLVESLAARVYPGALHCILLAVCLLAGVIAELPKLQAAHFEFDDTDYVVVDRPPRWDEWADPFNWTYSCLNEGSGTGPVCVERKIRRAPPIWPAMPFEIWRGGKWIPWKGESK